MRIGDRKRIAVTLLLVMIWLQLAFQAADDIQKSSGTIREHIFGNMAEQCLELYSPYLLYADSEWSCSDVTELIRRIIWKNTPLYQYFNENVIQTGYAQSQLTYDAASILEGRDEEMTQPVESQETLQASVQVENYQGLQSSVQAENQTAASDITVNQANGQAGLRSEDEGAAQTIQEVMTGNGFVPASKKAAEYSQAQLRDPDFIKKQFYTEDATTQIKPEQLSYDKLMGFDATIQQDNTMPQILIYHTHSQEGFADSDPSDASTTIMGVGEYLSAILRNQYGFNVLHHMGQYDVESRDYAYANAAKGIEEVLAQNPSIEVMIDLHRDEMREDVKLVTSLQNRDMAKFMFFNGLSYTRERGEITSLPNPYIQENLSFAFQMKLAAEEYYPGLTRKSYLKGYRYNLQYRPKSLLIELGAQTNTLEEAMNACQPLAHIIAMVLKGESN